MLAGFDGFSAKMIAQNKVFLFASLLVALCAGLLFIPGLPGVFVFDDLPNIVNNQGIQLSSMSSAALVELLSAKQVSGTTRSLPMLSFAVDYWRAGGAEPGAFKTTNILIHILTTAILAFLFRALLLRAALPAQRAAWMALFLALVWAIHPLQVSAVLYVVQRLQTMSTLFLVLALLSYIRARQAQISGASDPGSAFLLTVLFWLLALASKEDAALLPAYTLALELTLLRFAAASDLVARRLRRGYVLASIAALLIYCFWVLPHYWHWDAYPGRDFSSAERLLTQLRVLCLYLWQIVLPLPQQMPFYYDWIEPSRSLLQPWTTFAALLSISALLGTAWHLRHRQPLFALGVFWFFAAHFITSNVIGLEIAFEHRNHFALIGAVLALGSLVANLLERLRQSLGIALCAALLIALAGNTLLRSAIWSTRITFAEASTRAAPDSPRAWVDLCDGYFKVGGGPGVAHNPLLEKAIQACTAGANAKPDTLNSLVVLLVLKTVAGTISPADWQRLHQRLAEARLSWDNARAPVIFLHYAELGVKLDKEQVLKTLAMLSNRTALSASSLAQIGQGIIDGFADPDQALPYFLKAIAALPVDDSFPEELAAQLRDMGRADLALRIKAAARERAHSQ